MQIKIVGFVDDIEILRDMYEAYFGKYFQVKTFKSFKDINDFMDCNFWIFDNDTKENIFGIEMIQVIKNSILFSSNSDILKENYSHLADRIFAKICDKKIIVDYINKFFEKGTKTKKE